MKAILHTRYGGPETLHLSEIPKPSPKDDEVLVKVISASLNDWDWALLSGDFINRITGGWYKPRIQVLGSDIAGIVESVGNNVKRFKPGDEVFGDLSGRWGGFAEYVCAPEKMLALKSAAMSFDEAAAIPQAAMLAVQALIDKGKMKSGQQLLINGAGGGVGTFGIQLARMHGVEVTAVDSGPKLEMLRSLGAAEVIDYTKQDFTKSGRQFDLVLDVKTNRSPFAYLRPLKPGGSYLTVGGSIPRLLQTVALFPWIKAVSKKNVRLIVLKTNKDLEYMKQLFEAGQVKPVIDGPWNFAETPEAFAYFGRAEHKGKVVVRVAE